MSGHSSSDDDYMSDKFLNPQSVRNERKSSAIGTNKVRRTELCPGTSKTIKRETLMEVTRENGLNTKISQENIGFKLMMKMGFKPDSGLGKNAEGRTEPVSVEIFDKGVGLGLHNIQQKRKMLAAANKQHREEKMQKFQKDFRGEMALRFRLEKCHRQLARAQKICQEFDLAQNLEPAFPEFWPVNSAHIPIQSTDAINPDASTSSGIINNEKIDVLYLSEDNILQPVLADENADFCDLIAAPNKYKGTDSTENLLRISHYLRESYFYCFWCATKFTDLTDLQTNCPGPQEDDHG